MDRNDNARLLWYITDVALRKESVDRNAGCAVRGPQTGVSLSARRAWIEMGVTAEGVRVKLVALRKESVDRNVGAAIQVVPLPRRSPQGERG